MRKIVVPITSRLLGLEDKNEIVRQLRLMEAEHVFIGIGSPKTDAVKRKEELKLLTESCAFLAKEGFKTAVWLWSFLLPDDNNYQHMVASNGKVTPRGICPLDEGYIAFYHDYIKDIVRYAKPDMVLLDDDFGLGRIYGLGIGCFCPAHLKRLSEAVGEEITLDSVEKKFFCGKANKYRHAYIDVMRNTLIEFADKLRAAVNTVDPKVRIGVCSLMSAWDSDGVSSYEIAKHLAGDTKPFVRLIGAPYWAVNKWYGNNRLQDVIDIQRMEASWRDGDEEVIYEGDVFPRPRYATPANFLEAFDMALLADGTADGILKYVIDFCSHSTYETGYIDRHVRNIPNYDWIQKNMRDKTAAGVRVYEFMHTVKTATLPEEYVGDTYLQERYATPASKIMSGCSVPITYKGEGCGAIAFGENVRYLSEEQIRGGLITDAGGAKVLEERGIDTGIESWEGEYTPILEYFHEQEEQTAVRGTQVQKAILRPEAEVQSSFICGDEKIPASFYYKNDRGDKFLIFTFDAYRCKESMFRQYTRQYQLMEAPERLCGKTLPVKITGHPDLYVMVKEDENSLSVGLWNLFPDSVYAPVVKLAESFESIDTCSCTAQLKGDCVELSDIAPYGFAAFTLYGRK